VDAQLTELVGPRNISRIAHALGVTSPLDDFFAIGLGVNAVNPLEMARAFSTFADGGTRVDTALFGNAPRAVLQVVDGRRTDMNEPRRRPILDPNENAILTSILERVVAEGTGVRAQLGDRPAAGKTGTTENYGDAWFVGFTPQLVTAVWVGYPNALKPMKTEFNGDPVAGGTLPALIWKTFMQAALRKLDDPPEAFPAPSYPYAAPLSVVYRDGSWERDNGLCRDARVVVYFSGFGPKKEAGCKPNEVDVPKVVGATLADAEARLASMPLTPEVITRPAKPGERLGVVVAQFPSRGPLSSWDKVKLVVPKALHGTIPDVVGLRLGVARAKLDRRKLVGVVDAFGQGDPGIVLAQNPKPGLAAAPSFTVKLIVGR
jgi:membrane peptidoglycan carboxypeptidase